MNLTQQPTRIPVRFQDESSFEADVCSEAMSRARSAQPSWAVVPLSQKLRLVRKLRHLIAEHGEELAGAVARARGRPVPEAMSSEVLPLAEACRFLERNVQKILAPARLGTLGRPLWLWGVWAEVHREPYGVILIIGPGNYPLFLPGVQIVQALVAGNAVLLKPGEGGTAVAQILCRLILEAGLAAELIEILPESVRAARAAIAARPDKVNFTGSAPTGREILWQLAPQLIPATLELSGADSVIVRPDADLQLAAKALSFGLRLNNGATCISPKRVFVAAAMAPKLEAGLAEQFRQLATGNQILAGSQARSHTASSRNKARALIDEALLLGAHLVAGSADFEPVEGVPIVLGGVPPEARILKDEVFGPVMSMVSVESDREAVRLANDCPFGLGASIFSRDEVTSRRLAQELNVGVVTINDIIIPTADARLPFGGRGNSGFGVTRGAEGLLELSRPKVVTSTKGKYRPALGSSEDWHQQLFRGYLRATHGWGLGERFAGLLEVLRAIFGNGKTVSKEGV